MEREARERKQKLEEEARCCSLYESHLPKHSSYHMSTLPLLELTTCRLLDEERARREETIRKEREARDLEAKRRREEQAAELERLRRASTEQDAARKAQREAEDKVLSRCKGWSVFTTVIWLSLNVQMCHLRQLAMSTVVSLYTFTHPLIGTG